MRFHVFKNKINEKRTINAYHIVTIKYLIQIYMYAFINYIDFKIGEILLYFYFFILISLDEIFIYLVNF